MTHSRLSYLGYTSYDQYLKSSHWRDFKIQYKMSGRPKECQKCNNPRYQLHHLTYDRLGCERLDDVMPLCGDCHMAEHGIASDGKPIKKKTVISKPLQKAPKGPSRKVKKKRKKHRRVYIDTRLSSVDKTYWEKLNYNFERVKEMVLGGYGPSSISIEMEVPELIVEDFISKKTKRFLP